MQEEPFDQLGPRSSPPRSSMPLGKTVLFNFGLMVIYMLLTSLTMDSGPEAGMGVLAMDAFLILAQVGLNMFIGLILLYTENHKQLGGAMLISGVIMGVVGFGSCLAHAAILES